MHGIRGLSLMNSVSSINWSYCQPLLCPISPRISLSKPSVCCSKLSCYQDFQDYARPLRLLPVTIPKSFTPPAFEEMSTSLRGDSQSVYVVRICTSTMSGSGLSDSSAGILLCLIDENGDAVLQRISATPQGISANRDLPDICFQRGSADEFFFSGPNLGRIRALWISLESARWRLGGVSVSVVNRCNPSLDSTEDHSSGNNYCGFQYGFEAEDIQVGEIDDMSMVELKPCQVTELCGNELLDLPNIIQSQSTSLVNREVSNQESMKEYAGLKSSLLLYDSMLIFAGTSIAAFSSGEEAALAFLVGGAGGFLYLLLLQKSVDGLPVPESITRNMDETDMDRLLKQLKGPVSSLALALAFAGVAVKYGLGATPIALTPQDILVGMTGFLACKVAVLLAAFKPVQITVEENK